MTIEDFLVKEGLGWENQVGLYLQGDETSVRKFYWQLQRAGFRCRPQRYTNEARFNHFAFVEVRNQQLSKDELAERVRAVCNDHCPSHSGRPEAVDYATWQASFESYLQKYRAKRLDAGDTGEVSAFDKTSAYQWIQDGHYEEAERYLLSFATGAAPVMVPIYLIYLYHRWERFEEVTQVYERYEEVLRTTEVDRRLVEWIVAAYVALDRPEDALSVLDEYLPEFQRQGVADALLGLRAQARAIRGELPRSAPDLHAYLARVPSEELVEKLDELLLSIVELAGPLDTIEGLLDALEERLPEHLVWQITKERSELARRRKDWERALQYVRSVLQDPHAPTDEASRSSLHLEAADLLMRSERVKEALAELEKVDLGNLSPDERRLYWEHLGSAYFEVGRSKDAFEALRHAYESGGHRPEVLRRLGRPSFKQDSLELAREVYEDLLEEGFKPGVQDALYAGIIQWLNDNHDAAVDLLQPALQHTLESPLLDTLPSEDVVQACVALVDSLPARGSSKEDVVWALGLWSDTLVAYQDVGGMVELVRQIAAAGLDHETTFVLLEPLEPLLCDVPEGRDVLTEIYVRLLTLEADLSLRHERPLPGYVRHLRKGLFFLDETQAKAAEREIVRRLDELREAQLVESGFALEAEDDFHTLDLGERKVVLIGGYAPVRRRARKILEGEFQLGRFSEVAPSWEARVDEGVVADAVRGADLIIVVHRCLKHDGTNALHAAIDGTELEDRVRFAPGKGHSSVVRVAREYFTSVAHG